MIARLIAAYMFAAIVLSPAPGMWFFGATGRHVFYISSRNKRRLSRKGLDVADFYCGEYL